MSSPSSTQVERGRIALFGCVLLLFLALAWTATMVFSASEPSFVAAFIGIPTFLITPIVTGCLLFLLRRAKHSSAVHRVAFYGSAVFLAAWILFLTIGGLSK